MIPVSRYRYYSRSARLLTFAFSVMFALLTGCDATPLGVSGNAGVGGASGSTSTAGTSGTSGSFSTHGPTVTFPSTTSIVVKVPQTASGGNGGTGGSNAATGGDAGTAIPSAPQCVPAQPAGTDTGVCGDGFRSTTEACDDGNTLPNDGCSPTCQITPQLVSQRVPILGMVTRINAGSGDTIGDFGLDRFYSGGDHYSTDNPVSTIGVENAAPPEVYQSEHVTDFLYTLSGLSPRVVYTVRLHFAEIWYGDADVGARLFNVEINDTRVLENFDVVSAAGGANKAVVRDFGAAANSDGQIIVKFVSVVDTATVSALELIPPTDEPPLTVEPLVRINAGDAAAGRFEGDEFVDGGSEYSNDNVITTDGIANAAPAEVYQSERWGNFHYTLSDLAPGSPYIVRLHFAEIYYSTPGSRAFNVWVNDEQVLELFDIVREAGEPNKAVVRDFGAIANADGQIVVTFEGRIDNAKLSALELFRPAASRTIGKARHPLVAGCNVVAATFSDQHGDSAAVFLSTFEAAGHPLSSVRVAQTHVSTPNPGVAALPGDNFVVSWTDFDEDELGISLREVVSGVPQGNPVIANEDPAFSQSESDIVFDGNELVVAWLDSRDPLKGPDLHYRLFTPDLVPISGDQVLAATDAVEDNVVLAGRNGHWAAAWRAGSQGQETIEVQSGPSHWTVGPFLPGATEDRPDLIFLDDTRLAVAFTKGTDPDNTGEANVPRLHAAVLDPRMPGATESFGLAPAQMPYATDMSLGQTDPSLVLTADHVLVAWRSEARPGEHLGSELWSRRVPFTVTGDSVTLDPSHLEMPLVQTDAQREGEQGAFRMVATTLWPSGGIASIWDDSSRSFGAKSAGPDVVLQIGPDFKEPPPPPQGAYAVSDDGLYYKVNLLRRNYPGPTVSTSYQGDAAYFTPQLVPEYLFDGDDSQWGYKSVSGTDPNAGATVTIDMGQYFSVGGVRLLYYYTGNAPPTQSLRLAAKPTDAGDWQTILDNMPAVDDHIYSFNAVTARFLELKMKGTPRGIPMEIEVYPSTQSGPPPTPNDGYDLSYFATATANNNCGAPVPWLWSGAAIYAKIERQSYPPYATGDCVGTYDLGAQYPISRVYANFYVGSNWSTGGRIDVAAVPGAYSNVYDSGVGNQFAFTDTMGFTFPSQPVRYVRMTDYAVPGGRPAAGILQSIQAFVTPPSRTAYFPLSDDSRYFKVNLLRRPSGVAPPTVTATYGGSAAPHPNPSTQLPANAIDGDDLPFWWYGGTNPADASATLTVDLGQVVSLGAIRQVYHLPATTYGLRVAESSGNWTTLVDLSTNSPLTFDQTLSFSSKQVRYIELTTKGNGISGVMLRELMVYPSSTALPAPSSENHLDLTHLNGISIQHNENMNFFGDGNSRLGGAWRGKTIAEGATGDGTLTVDLGQQYQISQVNLAFYGSSSYPNGGKVEVSDGSGTWTTVHDSGEGTPLAPNTGDGPVVIPFSARSARFVRVTEYMGTVAETNMENIEIF